MATADPVAARLLRSWRLCRGRWLRALAALLFAAALFPLAAAPALADTVVVRGAELRVEDDGYFLNAEFEFAINATFEEALQKGVPLYFVLEFELTRPRWYWLDEKALSYSIQYRVAWNALTRQYRVASGLYSQNLGSIAEVERLVGRVTSRPIARVSDFARGARYEAAVRLRLDVNQLPKPFQVTDLA